MIKQYEPLFDRTSIAEELYDYAMSDGYFTEYKITEKFENMLADFLAVNHCVVVSNGTISLSLALLAYGVKPGDKVLVPNITMIATSNAVRLIGAFPIFVDIDPLNGCMDINKVEEFLDEFNINASALIYVTLNGRSHSFEDLMFFEYRLYSQFGISVIYDNAQSLGSKTERGYISCNGTIGSFSFSMPKIITTGQGGCLVTNDPIKYNILKKMKDFGRSTGGIDIHNEFGINCKITELQAIMGVNQMCDLERRISKKKEIYDSYKSKLGDTFFLKSGIEIPWFIDIYCERRDELKDYLFKNGIQTRPIYPELTSQLVNFQKPFSLKHSKDFANKGLWLPCSLNIKEDEIDLVCLKIKEFYA